MQFLKDILPLNIFFKKFMIALIFFCDALVSIYNTWKDLQEV